jgi:citrate synthase
MLFEIYRMSGGPWFSKEIADFAGPRSISPPLSLILAGLAAYLASQHGSIPASSDATLYQENLEEADRRILQTVASYAVIFSVVRCHRLGIGWQPPALGRTYHENLFIMSGLVDPNTAIPDPTRLSCFRRFSLLNADHGMALAVFSALVTASSLTDPISCLITSVAAAHGPLHFGATDTAQRALKEIGDLENVPSFLDEVKSGNRKLFGYGHRSYKGTDPRVRPIREILRDLTEPIPFLKLAEAIEMEASTDEYFISRRLYPNADFYGSFVFTGMSVLLSNFFTSKSPN